MRSFSRKGNPYDNAYFESFHSTIKKEEIYLNIYQNFQECRKAIL
ncbi:integrase core domain-containing protein [Eubacterium aggregans]